MTKFKNTFRIESARLQYWDYSTPWWYYVTICTRNHINFFGSIKNGKIVLNELGIVAEKCWLEIPHHFKNIELDYYVIMPNHIHGIININCVETPYMVSLPLGDIIGKYKAAVKRWCTKNGFKNFLWQPRFYDRIIRNEKELFNIRNYIEQNPAKWALEKNKLQNQAEL